MKTYIGRGDVFKEKERQRRTLRYSSLEPSGLYAQKGAVLTVAQGMQDSLSITIGSPERETQKQYPLTKGITTITVENEGPILMILVKQQSQYQGHRINAIFRFKSN